MAHIELGDDALRVDLSTLDKVWAMHGSLEIPYAHIVGAQVVDENGWQHAWTKLIGTSAPGIKMAGTFFVDGGLAFLDYGSGDRCLVLQTQHERYKTVIVQLDAQQDAAALADDISKRVAA